MNVNITHIIHCESDSINVENILKDRVVNALVEDNLSKREENLKLTETVLQGGIIILHQELEKTILSKKYDFAIEENIQKEKEKQVAEKKLFELKKEEENRRNYYQICQSSLERNRQKFVPFFKWGAFLTKKYLNYHTSNTQQNMTGDFLKSMAKQDIREDKSIGEEKKFENKQEAEIKEEKFENIPIEKKEVLFFKPKEVQQEKINNYVIKKISVNPPSRFGNYEAIEENNKRFILRSIRKGEEEVQKKVAMCYESLLLDKKTRINDNKLRYDPLFTERFEDKGSVTT